VQTAYSPISSSSSFSYSSSSSSSSASYGYHLNIMVCGVLYTQLQWFIFLCDFLMGHHVFVYIYIYFMDSALMFMKSCPSYIHHRIMVLIEMWC
jgi:hypothetical protein